MTATAKRQHCATHDRYFYSSAGCEACRRARKHIARFNARAKPGDRVAIISHAFEESPPTHRLATAARLSASGQPVAILHDYAEPVPINRLRILPADPRAHDPARPRQGWSADQLTLLRTRYPDTPAAELAAELGRTRLAVYVKAQKLGLTKAAP